MVGVDRLERIFAKLFDESEFLSPYGLRAISAYHRDHPYELDVEGIQATIDYEPAESTTAMFGGNSNWRGPCGSRSTTWSSAPWSATTASSGTRFQIEYPTGSGQKLTLGEIAQDLRQRLISIFLVGADGRRPCFGGVDRLQHDPAWKDNLVFNEYFHGDNGAGLGASHQTGWTGVVADTIRRRHGDVACPRRCAARASAATRRRPMTPLRRARRHAGSPGRAARSRSAPRPMAGGTNFAVASGVAEGVVLCLFDEAGAETQIPLQDYDAGVWHGFVPGVGPGQAYGYRDHRSLRPGPRAALQPGQAADRPLRPGHRPARCSFGPEVLGYAAGDPDTASDLDSAGSRAPQPGRRPRLRLERPAPGPGHRYADTVIYEVHVKGFTMTHPDVPPELRGTYAGLGHEAALAHLVDLGVTAVELLPVHQSVPESFLLDRGLTNYWGYNTIGFFAPHDGYSAAVRAGRPGGQVAEFKAMVDALHGAGLEVILDVVFNHTAEGNQLGPTLCFRGLDNPAYYHLVPGDPRHYVDTTGCGNTVNAGDPTALRLIMDSLRYWLTEMRVDGFRFDLAPSLARQEGGFDQVSAFFDLVSQDPVVSQAKLVAEPWDVGQTDSYELGRFPPLWREWNGKYRDTMRDFWRSHDGLLGDFADPGSPVRPTSSPARGGGRRHRST